MDSPGPAWELLGRGILARQPIAALRDAYARTDIVALDLDECIFPGYSQTALGARVARRLLRKPDRPGQRRLLARLAGGGLLFAVKEVRRWLGAEPPMRRLVAWYEWVMRGVPEHYLLEEAQALPPKAFPFAAETVAELARKAPTGIITLGLDIVARAFVAQFSTIRGPSLDFFASNVVTFAPDPRGEPVFEGYAADRYLLDGNDKVSALGRIMADYGAIVPLTVGHSDDDVGLARLARERGGLAIGFNPRERLWGTFDIVALGESWAPVYAVAAILAAPEGADQSRTWPARP